MGTRIASKGIICPHIVIRLTILGLGVSDLITAMNERCEAEGRRPVHYTCVSKAFHGKYEPRSAEILGMAEDITYRWIDDTARDYIRVLKPRLEARGVITDGATTRLTINHLQRPVICVEDYLGKTVAIYDIAADSIDYLGGY